MTKNDVISALRYSIEKMVHITCFMRKHNGGSLILDLSLTQQIHITADHLAAKEREVSITEMRDVGIDQIGGRG